MRIYRLGRLITPNGINVAPRPRHRHSWLELTDNDLDTHMFVPGTTGGGKSRLLRQLWREHDRNGRGCCIVEPGDLIDDILADVAWQFMHTGDRSLLERIHLVELNPFQMPRYDSFRFRFPENIHPELKHVVYRAWQHTRVQSRAEIYQLKQNQSTDFEGMPNLHRNMINVLTAVSTLANGRRLSLGDAEILIDLYHPDHDRVYQRVLPLLDRNIQSDFEILHEYRNVRDLRNDVGSLVNRFRTTHGPLLKELISGDDTLPSIDLERIVRSGQHLFVKTARTPYVSNDQTNALAGMMIHDIQETAYLLPRAKRRPFTLMIDEFHKYCRSGIGEMARTARKFNLGLVFATTDLVSLKRGDFDGAAELLSVVNTVISYRLTWPEDLNRLAEFLYAQNIDFTELVHEVERRAGPEWIQVDEWSESIQKNRSHSTNSATTSTTGSSSQRGTANGASRARGVSVGPSGANDGTTTTVVKQQTVSEMLGQNHSDGIQRGEADTEGESHGVTINHKWVHLEKFVRESQKSGILERSVADQFARFAQELSGHARRRATVRIREQPACVFETAEVTDRFRSPEAQEKAVEWIKRELAQVHDYYFTPTLDPEEQKRRIDAFVGDMEVNHVPRNSNQKPVGASPLL
ncbi:hypothetical protein GC176_18365 [bacterium]|nr:hypothetical protein [bacterium]